MKITNLAFRLVTITFSIVFVLASLPFPYAAATSTPAPSTVPRIRRQRLPASVCTLTNAQVICYDAEALAPRTLTPGSSPVTDFGIAPDGRWLIYRIASTVMVTAIYENVAPLTVDTAASPPADLDSTATTLTWSPDGIAIAYITANGLRVAFPPAADLPAFADQIDRPYTNLRFSPDGANLGAQSSDGNWSIFQIDTAAHRIKRLRTIDQAGDLAWLNDTDFVFAYLSGGLVRLQADQPAKPPVWTLPNEHFIKMISTSSGKVLAIHPDPGDTIGSAVEISPEGTVAALGDSKLDSSVRWGPDGRVMVYITSGTPILVDRSTGAENLLPFSDVSRLVWSPPLPLRSDPMVLDSDLYFLAFDSSGISQVWRIRGGSGDPAQQVTFLPYAVESFSVSPDHSQLVVAGQDQLIAFPFVNPRRQRLLVLVNGPVQLDWRTDGKFIAFTTEDGTTNIVSATPVSYEGIVPNQHSPRVSSIQRVLAERIPGAVPRFSMDGNFLLVAGPESRLIDVRIGGSDRPVPAKPFIWLPDNRLIGSTENALVMINADGTVTSIATGPVVDAEIGTGNSVIFLRSLGWPTGPTVIQRFVANINTRDTQKLGHPGILADAQLSPSGRFAAAVQQSGKIRRLAILDLETGQLIQVRDDVSSLHWVR